MTALGFQKAAPGCFLVNPLRVTFTCDSGDVSANTASVEISVVVKLKGVAYGCFTMPGSNGHPGLGSRVLTFLFSDPVGLDYS